MGLDMYLYAELYGSRYYGTEFGPTLATVAEQFEMPVYDEFPSFQLRTTAAYWRKANAIHKWFVDNVQDGVDDCRPYPVSLEQLRELRELCEDIRRTKDEQRARAELPPQTGFFFGGTDIDEGYWADLHDTVLQLDKILNSPRVDQMDFTYQSSW